MSKNGIAILQTRETIFFSHEDGKLRQWIMATIENHLDQSMQAMAVIKAGGEKAITELLIEQGVREYRCYAPVLWHRHPPVSDALLHLTAGGNVVASTTSVGAYRPWKVYLLSDVCADYTWAYDDEKSLRRDDAELTEAEIALAEATLQSPESDRNHYNFVHAREAEFYLERYPDRAERLFDHIRRGTITFNPIFNMCITSTVSLEELIRQLYPARNLAVKHGLDIGYANHQETPTITWGAAMVLAGSGVKHLVKSIYPYECVGTERLEEPPVFAWKGPDGSRILVRRTNKHYTQGKFVFNGLQETNAALHDEIIPRYEAIGEPYSFDAIALVGCYGDLSSRSKGLPAKKSAAIAAYNAQDWEYPKLINASHKQFWDDIDTQISEQQIEVPTYHGDYGTSWDAWPVSLAHDAAAWRRAQERSATADKLAVVLSVLDRDWHETHREKLGQGWMNLIYLADHAWNGSGDKSRVLNASLRREWQTTANQAFDAVIADGLATLGKYIPTGEDNRIMVFNGLGWSRTGRVRAFPTEEVGRPCQIIDIATEKAVPSQVVEENGQSALYFEAHDVPPVGYRVFRLQQTEHPQKREEGWKYEGCRLDGRFYAIEISPITGGVVSLYDKIRGRELVDPNSPYHLNQCLYFSEGAEYTPDSAQIEAGTCGAVFGQLISRASFKDINVTTTITLYANTDRVDIRNEVEKQPTTEHQELDFAFPFLVPDREYRIETPGVILTPGTEQRPGSAQAITAVRHFVDVFNEEFGVLLSQTDSFLVEFGHRTTMEDPMEPDASNSTILALALSNCTDWKEVTRDQNGVTRFTFRYSLRGHKGGFDPAAAVRFGWEDNNELLAVPLPRKQKGTFPAAAHSFVKITPDNVILTCLKAAEEDGIIIRLWECAGCDTNALVDVSGLGLLQAAKLTNLLEEDERDLTVTDSQVTVPVQKRGIATVRLLFELSRKNQLDGGD